MLRHYFRPNLAGLFCLLLLFVAEWPMQSEFSYYSGSTPALNALTHTETSYGVPPLIVIKADYHQETVSRNVRVEWLSVGLVLLIGYLAAMPLGQVISGRVFPGQPEASARPIRTLLLLIASVGVLAAIATLITYRFFPNLLDDSNGSLGEYPWLVIWTSYTLVGSLPTIFIALIVMCVKRIREARRARTKGFAVLPVIDAPSAAPVRPL